MAVSLAANPASPARDAGPVTVYPKGTPMGSPRTAEYVLKAIKAHPDQQITIHELIEETGLTREQVINAIGSLRRRGRMDIETLMSGALWVWHSQPRKKEKNQETPPLFAELARTKLGDIILEDENGTLWKAEKL
jgi:hypothetical protein